MLPHNSKNQVFSSVALALFLFVATVFAFPGSAAAGPVNASELIELTNREREALSLPPFAPNHQLTQAAFRKAGDMLEKGYFAHTTPDSKPFYRWIEDENYYYLYAGENLAIDFETSEGVVAAWMASPTHRANIVNENYSDIGLVAVRGNWQDRETTVVVQMFGSLLQDSPTVLGRAFENITNNLNFRKGDLANLAADVVLLPSLAGPRYFDAILRPNYNARLALSGPGGANIAASPATPVGKQETFRTLVKSESATDDDGARFVLTESSNGTTFSAPVRYPTVREVVRTLSEKKINFLATPENLSRDVLLAGIVLLLLLIAYEPNIRRLLARA
ncbi:MAG: hypothetical protein HY462_01630 [Parcubacteria group bacterium]|nr:hypothetical protein [Parcubacteria group bacterium]